MSVTCLVMILDLLRRQLTGTSTRSLYLSCLLIVKPFRLPQPLYKYHIGGAGGRHSWGFETGIPHKLSIILSCASNALPLELNLTVGLGALIRIPFLRLYKFNRLVSVNRYGHPYAITFVSGKTIGTPPAHREIWPQ